MEQISQATGLPKRIIGEDAMAVLQSHDWPGNVRQLRNNVERLMILAGGDPDAVINADMLPQDVGSMVPSMPGGDGGEHLMGLPLRDAREVFEREYLRGADQPVRRQYLTHRRVRRHGALGAPSQAQGARNRLMSRIAYVNGRYLPRHAATVHIEDRGYQFSDGVYEVCEVRGGRLVDERLHIARLDALARRIAHRHADVDRRARCGHARNRAPQPRARRHCLPADHPRRGAARSRLSAARHGAERGGDRPQSRFRRQRKTAADGIAVITVPDNRWERVDIKSVSLLPNVLAKQAAREQGAKEAWFVDHAGKVTEGSSTNAWIVTMDGEVVTRPADHGILRGITRTVLLDVIRAQGLKLVERAFTVEEAYGAREAFVSSASMIVMPVVRIDGRPIGNGAPGLVATALRRDFHRHAEFS